MELFAVLGAIWLFLCCDAYVVTHRRRNSRPVKPVDIDEEHDLLYTSPRFWIEHARALAEKGRKG